MFHRGRRITMLSRGAVVAVVALCSLATAAAASAATLSTSVVPAKVPTGKGYAIRVQGTFHKGELSGKAYMISVIQFSAKPCLGSAQAEANHRGKTIQYYLAPQSDPRKGNVGVFENHSPFTNKRSFTAGSLGVRHVCSYLYPKFIPGPLDNTRPIAKADAKYTVTAH